MGECKQAQSHEQQIAELKDSRLPKTEREHAAVREIERLEQRLAEMEAKLPKWILVGEKLPEEYRAVLICVDGFYVSYGQHINNSWYEDNMPLELHGETVTHWMPRPEPPASRKEKR